MPRSRTRRRARSLRRLWLPAYLDDRPPRPRAAACRTDRPSPCTTSTGSLDGVEFGQAIRARIVARLRAGGCSGNARHSTPGRAGGCRRAAGDARARRAPADDDQSHAAQPVAAQLLEHGDPRRVELVRRCPAGPAPGDAVGLLDERDADVQRQRDARVAATRSGAPTPPPAPWPRTSAPTGASARCRCATAGPCGVSSSIVFTREMLPRRAAARVRGVRSRACPTACTSPTPTRPTS